MVAGGLRWICDGDCNDTMLWRMIERFMKVHPYALAIFALAFPPLLKSRDPDLRSDPLGVPAEQIQSAYSNGLGASPRKHTWEGDLTIADAVNLALSQNLEILKAIREIERSQGRVVQLRALALPHISMSASLGDSRQKTDPAVFLAASVQTEGSSAGGGAQTLQSRSWNVSFELRQAIYSGGAIPAQIEAAKFLKASAYYSLRNVVDKVISDVRSQFSNVLVTHALIEVSQESVELASQQLKDAQNRFNAGTVPRFNVLRAEVEVASVRPQLIRAKNDHLIAQLQLAKLLALDPPPSGSPSFRCVGDLDVSERDLDLANSIALGKARRPSLKSLRQQMLAGEEGVKEVFAGFKPQLNAVARGGWAGAGRQQFIQQMESYFLGLQGSWAIFDSFETAGKVAQERAKLKSLALSYEDEVRQVELEIQRAFANLQQYWETIESQQKNVQQALEALRLAQERLSAGAGTQLEVLDARVALTRARTTELQARGEYVRTLAEFDRATATETTYQEEFNDPLLVLEQRVLKRDYSFLLRP